MKESSSYKIPLNRQNINGSELHYIAETIFKKNIRIQGNFYKKASHLIENQFSLNKCLLTNSFHSATQIASILINTSAGDEIIFPSNTSSNITNPFLLRGAKPVFIDLTEDTLNIDDNLIDNHITPNTKAIYVTHNSGVACEMERIMSIANRRNICVLEDLSQSFLSKYRDRYVGSIGHIGILNFSDTQNFSCGQGGALTINHPGLIEEVNFISNDANLLMPEITSAFLCAQLQNLENDKTKIKAIREKYEANLKQYSQSLGFKTPYVPSHCEASGNVFYILIENKEKRDELSLYLKSRGIETDCNYLKLNSSENQNLQNISNQILRLPFYLELNSFEIDYICEEIVNFLSGKIVNRKLIGNS